MYRQSKSGLSPRKLNRTLVGNCLGMCKSLGVPLSGHISADCTGLSSIRTNQNRQSMIGFVGTFEINLKLPDLIGLGKSVSRGFGTVERQC
ncbi:MAG: CRISPR-associated endonuclease Cas6 [Pirellulaceae bacterium]